ncbi:hypothetical protein D9Q98_006446 [Chlorella vulgaris]|uniref:Uncharacterized protein n=1 Tax=Chlorella vulgaris TaxID=3077 RepID=A0A9D4TKL4_CHLVU|nr:hypothetical protein D9Q98_006446 [Chlorella vulgaris]
MGKNKAKNRRAATGPDKAKERNQQMQSGSQTSGSTNMHKSLEEVITAVEKQLNPTRASECTTATHLLSAACGYIIAQGQLMHDGLCYDKMYQMIEILFHFSVIQLWTAGINVDLMKFLPVVLPHQNLCWAASGEWTENLPVA